MGLLAGVDRWATSIQVLFCVGGRGNERRMLVTRRDLSRVGGEGAARNKPGSVAAAVALYLGSMEFGNLAHATQYDRRLILERFRERHGAKSFASLERRHVDLMIAEKSSTPHAAKNFLKALRAVAAVALRAGLCEADPTIGVRVKARASEHGFRAWSDDDIADRGENAANMG
jgi:hypothetical protein